MKRTRRRGLTLVLWLSSWLLGTLLFVVGLPACGWSPTLWAEVRPISIGYNITVLVVAVTVSIVFALGTSRFTYQRRRLRHLGLVLSMGYAAGAWVLPALSIGYTIFDYSRETCDTTTSSLFAAYGYFGIAASLIGPVILAYAYYRTASLNNAPFSRGADVEYPPASKTR